MAVVPFTQPQPSAQQEMPDEKYLLLALGEMHNQGRFKVAGKPPSFQTPGWYKGLPGVGEEYTPPIQPEQPPIGQLPEDPFGPKDLRPTPGRGN